MTNKPELKEIEKAVLNMVIEGHTNVFIGEEIGYSEETIKLIIKKLFKHFNVKKRVELVREAFKQQIVQIKEVKNEN